MNSHTKVLLGLVLGAIGGLLSQLILGPTDPTVKFIIANIAQPVGKIFLNLIFMVVIPLIFSALVLGVAELGGSNRLGRIGGRTIAFGVVSSCIAVILGLLVANVFKPGRGIDPESRQNLMAVYAGKESVQDKIQDDSHKSSFSETIVSLIPKNPIEAATNAFRGGFLPFIIFSIIFGTAIATLDKSKTEFLTNFFDAIFSASLRVIEWAMKLAPIGVFGLVFSTAAVVGLEAFKALLFYALIVIGALIFHLVVFFGILIFFIAKISPWKFFKMAKEVMITGFATSSSNATLPTAIRVAINDFKIPRDISTFCLTLGAATNHNGTALFEGITVLFLAQFFGVDLSFADQIVVMGMALLGGIGTAGIPAGSWPLIALILIRFNVPAEAIGICVGIDRVLDMSRTVLNITGDLAVAVMVSAMEDRSVAAEKRRLASA